MHLIYTFQVLIISDVNHNYDRLCLVNHMTLVIYLAKVNNPGLIIALKTPLCYNDSVSPFLCWSQKGGSICEDSFSMMPFVSGWRLSRRTPVPKPRCFLAYSRVFCCG